MRNTDTIIIPVCKKRILLLFMASMLVATLGLWFLAQSWYSSAVEDYYMTFLGLALLVVCGCLSILWFKQLFTTKAGLELTDEGIVDLSASKGGSLIRWNDIVNFETKRIYPSNTPMLMIHVRNPDSYINKASNMARKSLLQMNWNIYETPLALTSTAFRTNTGDLQSILQTEWKKHQA